MESLSSRRSARRTPRVGRLVGWLVAAVALLPACGGGKGDGTASGSSGSPNAGGSLGATGGVGASGASGAGESGGVSSGGGTGGSGTFACDAPGERLASGACYVPCEYAPGSPPIYEAASGPCAKKGWKCTSFQYCNPNIHCLVDASCQKFGGPGWICVQTPTGPLVGQCALSCETDADCPDSKGATASPYVCQPVDTGTTVVKICGF